MNRKIKLDMDMLLRAFGRDTDYHDAHPQSVFLDLDTGEVFWVYKDDDRACFDLGIPEAENKANRERISDTPERYLEIPGFSHGYHHQILQDFLESEWTDDRELRQKTKIAYFGSIGAWKKEVGDDEIVYEYYNYKNSIIHKEAIEFLNNHGIEPIDKI